MMPLAASAASVPIPPWWGVALALVLPAVAGLVITRARLGLERDLIVAVVRAPVQLIAVGAVLLFIFKRAGLPGSFAWVVMMVALAGWTAGGRAKELPRARAVAAVGVLCGVSMTFGLLLGAHVIAAKPSVVVPLGGMIVSACLQGTSIVLTRIRDEVRSSRVLIEARLALGLPGAQAFAPHLALALRSALAPQIDQTKIVGLIALPGAMTGLIIAGVDPLHAIRYQIIVMYMWLGSASIAGLVCARLMVRELFDEAHRLRPLDVRS
jgi:putative ABC transport system permease protein